MMKTGISLYLGSGLAKNEEIIRKACRAKVSYGFTSLHIPEEYGLCYEKEAKELLGLCKDHHLRLFADIGPETLEKLGCSSFLELERTGITHIRLDYGISHREAAELSHRFHIVVNSSTVTDKDLKQWQDYGADFTNFAACHNYYPKPLTGLSIAKVKHINRRLKNYGFASMGFVAGDKELRGPLCRGLPTVEGHRNSRVLLNMLELNALADTDIVLVGDIDVKDETWQQLRDINDGYLSLHVRVEPEYEFVKDILHHERPDSSDYVIRSQESRNYSFPVKKGPQKPRPRGSISIGNEGYLRYNGELEIARMDLEEEPRVNIIGKVLDTDLVYLPYIVDGMGFRLV